MKVQKLLAQAIPSSIGMLVYFCQGITNVVFIGNLSNSTLLAGVGIGNMLQNIICYSTMIGLNGALDTLVS